MLIVAAADPDDTACKAVIEAVARLRRDTTARRRCVGRASSGKMNWSEISGSALMARWLCV